MKMMSRRWEEHMKMTSQRLVMMSKGWEHDDENNDNIFNSCFLYQSIWQGFFSFHSSLRMISTTFAADVLEVLEALNFDHQSHQNSSISTLAIHKNDDIVNQWHLQLVGRNWMFICISFIHMLYIIIWCWVLSIILVNNMKGSIRCVCLFF